jgi:hypothetical protein
MEPRLGNRSTITYMLDGLGFESQQEQELYAFIGILIAAG